MDALQSREEQQRRRRERERERLAAETDEQKGEETEPMTSAR